MEKNIYFYEELSNIVFILKIFFITSCTYYTNLKIICNQSIIRNVIISFIPVMLVSIVCGFVEERASYSMSIIVMVFMLSILHSYTTKTRIGYSILISIVSLGINYIIYVMSLIINFFIDVILALNNDFIRLAFIIVTHIIIIIYVFNARKFNKGIIFLREKINDDYFDILILYVSITIVLLVAILNNLNYINRIFASNLFFSFVIFSIIMLITIQKTLTMYYKHKLLIQDLNETKEELEITKKDRDKVEQENIKISKVNHSISHQIKSLNNKLEKLSINSEIANELDIKDRIDKISKEYARDKAIVDLTKTGVEVIDDMLECMKKECIENNIDFELQINGNIHYMTNNIISKDELEILLADHIKDAIIAIKHTDNINRSILVRLGLVDEFYCLYIYDTGIEFEIDTLINLGTRPITTHADEGGTGMGFLNTFDTLKKYNASMIIDEIGNPCKDNYTKVIMIKFDDKGVFKIKSYRSEEIKKTGINNNLEII